MRGSCHCGAVSYRIEGGVEGVTHCHCDTCRKVSGSVFSSNVFAPRQALEIVSGQDKLTAYESSPGKHRWFCGVCGAHIYALSQANPERAVIRAGTLDDDPGVRSARHIWTSQSAAWFADDADIPRFGEYPA